MHSSHESSLACGSLCRMKVQTLEESLTSKLVNGNKLMVNLTALRIPATSRHCICLPPIRLYYYDHPHHNRDANGRPAPVTPSVTAGNCCVSCTTTLPLLLPLCSQSTASGTDSRPTNKAPAAVQRNLQSTSSYQINKALEVGPRYRRRAAAQQQKKRRDLISS